MADEETPAVPVQRSETAAVAEDDKAPKPVTKMIVFEFYFPGCDNKNRDDKCLCALCARRRLQYQFLYNAIKAYRHVCRKGAAIFFTANAASAGLQVTAKGDFVVKMESFEAKLALGTILGGNILKTKKPALVKKDGENEEDYAARFKAAEQKAASQMTPLTYEMRPWASAALAEAWPGGSPWSDLSDGISADIRKVWMSKDPNFEAKIPQGVSMLNCMRKVPYYNGINVPLRARHVEFDGFKINIRMDSKTTLQAKIKKLDPGRLALLRRIIDGKYKMGDVRVGEGKLYVPYSFLPEVEKKTGNRVSEICISDDPDKFIIHRLHEDDETWIDYMKYDVLSARGALSVLKKLKGQQKYHEAVVASASQVRSGKARAAEQAVRERLTKHRMNVVKHWNHLWTTQLVRRVRSTSSVKAVLYKPPATLFNHPWQWRNFKDMLEYKFKSVGIPFEVIDAVAVDCGELNQTDAADESANQK